MFRRCMYNTHSPCLVAYRLFCIQFLLFAGIQDHCIIHPLLRLCEDAINGHGGPSTIFVLRSTLQAFGRAWRNPQSASKHKLIPSLHGPLEETLLVGLPREVPDEYR